MLNLLLQLPLVMFKLITGPSHLFDVAIATKKNIVVNHQNPKLLNPSKPATRGEITALVYQTLVYQGKIEPLPTNSPDNQYVVTTPINNQNTQ
ncbi:hypothetical protein [Nostoc sp. NZL]|uniref:hypothetical protein n=1 Tax=Nostoc sp. NZL TaxID=2650612 RepID=UPI001E3D58BF|nr:hypothetical protein [Nostoc sp. NZL]